MHACMDAGGKAASGTKAEEGTRQGGVVEWPRKVQNGLIQSLPNLISL